MHGSCNDCCIAGEILSKDKDYGDSVLAVSECQRQYPLSVGTSSNLAMALISIGRTRNARRVLEKISDLQGSNRLQAASSKVRFDLDEVFCDLALERRFEGAVSHSQHFKCCIS